MAEIKYIKANTDDFGIIQTTMQVLKVDEPTAVSFILEIGLVNLLSYPTGNEKIDTIIVEHNLTALIDKLKLSYCL